MAFIERSCFVTEPSFRYFIIKIAERKQAGEEIFKRLDQEERETSQRYLLIQKKRKIQQSVWSSRKIVRSVPFWRLSVTLREVLSDPRAVNLE